jgi:hypothetical protein
MIADSDISKDEFITPQTGLGAGIGVGTEFSVSKQLKLWVNPYINMHGIIPVKKEESYLEHILDYGIKIGIRTK